MAVRLLHCRSRLSCAHGGWRSKALCGALPLASAVLILAYALWDGGQGEMAEQLQRSADGTAELSFSCCHVLSPPTHAPTCCAVREVLRGLPFLQQVPEPLFDALLERGQLMGEPGSLLLPPCR